MRILIVDNYDSFTYNLVHQVEQFADDFDVIRNDKLLMEAVNDYDKIILSPGPGLPSDAGIMMDLIKIYAPTKSILGVCLGMQAMVECFGGKLYNMREVFHGVDTPITVIDKQEPLFSAVPSPFMAGRYHSWAVDRASLPNCFAITAVDEESIVMAVAHKEYSIKGVQFHPESIMTKHGTTIVSNWLKEKD